MELDVLGEVDNCKSSTCVTVSDCTLSAAVRPTGGWGRSSKSIGWDWVLNYARGPAFYTVQSFKASHIT